MMHYHAKVTVPELVPFEQDHPHKHFQLCRVEIRRGESHTTENVYVSCSTDGLGQKEIDSYLIDVLGAHPSLDRLSENDDWFWTSSYENLVKVSVVDERAQLSEACPIYSIEDPELQMLRRYYPNQFEYSI